MPDRSSERTSIPTNPAFEQRVYAARTMLSLGYSEAHVRAEHGAIVLQEAKMRRESLREIVCKVRRYVSRERSA